MLHANDHAFEDLAIALREPATNLAGRHAALSYGASWTVAQQALVGLAGVHHDGVALAAALWGAAALPYVGAALGAWPTRHRRARPGDAYRSSSCPILPTWA